MVLAMSCLIALLAAVPQRPSPEIPPQATPRAADVASPEAVLDALYATISGPAGEKRERAGGALERDGFFELEIGRQTQRFGDMAHVFSSYECKRARDDAEPFQRGINSVPTRTPPPRRSRH